MKKTVFECDVCKGQGHSIFEVKINIAKVIIGNGEPHHNAPPIDFTVQICGLTCLQGAIASKAGHALAKVEKGEEKEETTV